MRFTLFTAALLTSSATAGFIARQEEASTANGSTSTTSAADSSSTPLPTCSSECYKAQQVASSCHASNVDSLACYCTYETINALGDCLYCTQNIGTDEAKSEAASMEQNIADIVGLCTASSTSVAPPTKVSLTVSAAPVAVQSATVTIPAVAQASAASAKAGASGSSSGSKAASASGSKTTSATKPSGSASTSSNGANALEISLVGAAAGVLAVLL